MAGRVTVESIVEWEEAWFCDPDRTAGLNRYLGLKSHEKYLYHSNRGQFYEYMRFIQRKDAAANGYQIDNSHYILIEDWAFLVKQSRNHGITVGLVCGIQAGSDREICTSAVAKVEMPYVTTVSGSLYKLGTRHALAQEFIPGTDFELANWRSI